MARRGRNRPNKLSGIESLEARQLLAGDLVISEFMAINESSVADQDGDFEDWIEVHNPSQQEISLDGWYLTDDADNLTRWRFPAVTLSAGAYEIIHASGKDRIDAASELHTNFKLSGGGEFLALVRPDGESVEFAFSPEFPAQVSDVSYGLSLDQSQAGFFTIPTPGAENLQAPLADPLRSVVVNEVMYHPSSERVEEEYIELFNRGEQPIELGGWRLSGGLDFDFPDITIAAGDYLVVAANVDVFNETYGNGLTVVGPWTGKLSNSSDTITLRNASDDRIDRVVYADEGDWSVRDRGPDDRGHQGWIWRDDHDGGGKSLERLSVSMPSEFGQNWAASVADLGTPGRPNSMAASNIAPLILETRHSPPIPNSTQPVVVTSQIVDEDFAAVEVRLNWRVDGQVDFNSVPMLDDGNNGDSLAGDRKYQATLPAQPDLSVIEFYVEANDAVGNSRSWPAPTAESGQVANALYQVIDAFDPSAEWGPESHVSYFEIMTAAERQEFTEIDRRSNAQMNATFISVNQDGVDVRYNTGVRIRGSGSRNANPPNNRINLPSDNPWNGVTAINLNVDHVQDQIAGSALFRMAGLAAFDAKPVRMLSNGVNLFGEQFYAHVETLNSEFAEKHFPLDDGGNIYKGRRPNESPPGGRGAGLVYYEDPAAYVSYTKLTNESEADWSDVIHLTDVLNNSPDETYLEQIAEVIDVDQWLRHVGFHALLGNTEGGLVNGDRLGDDYAMYRGNEDTRFVMLPHDLDSLFSGVTRGIFNATNVPALRRLILHPEIRPRYYDHLHDMIDNVLLTDDARTVVDAALRGVQSTGQIDSIFEYLRDRAEYVRSITPTGIDIQHHLPAEQGILVSQRQSTELHGVADYRANSITVNGQLATLSTNGQWQLGSSTRTAVPTGATWTYLDNGVVPADDWMQPGFVPNADWGEGRAQLGYGDNDERTVLSFGDDPSAKPITNYFRHEFDVEDASRYLTLSMRLLRDDGAIVYVNGVEVARSNMPDGQITAATLANSNIRNSAERRYHTIGLDPAVLRNGTNVVAVEVHQFSANSADVSFDLSLAGRYQQVNGIPLNPGINRMVVRATSGLNGEGDVVATEFVDVLFDDGSVQRVTEDLPAGETTWTAAEGPYQVEGELTVPDDGVLRIEPGTTVYFAADARLTIRGKLIAQGTESQRIRMTSIPGEPWVPDLNGLPDGPARWSGIQFRDSSFDENIMAYVDLEYAQDRNGSIGVINSSLVVDHASFAGTHLRMVYGNNASLRVQDSSFPDMFAEGEDPAELRLDNISEQIKIVGRTPDGGELVIRNNVFGTNKGHNDVIDADSNRVTGGPILQILDNVFHGAGDELLDLGGDVYVAGNLFQNVAKDDSTSDRGYANAISTGDAGSNTTLVIARNVFYDVDHAINLKNDAATIFENNTVIQVHADFDDRFGNPSVNSAINLYVDEPGARPGKGAYAAGNIFWDLPRVFGNADLPGDRVTALQLDDNLLSEDVAQVSPGDRNVSTIQLGTGNRIGDPRLIDPLSGNFELGAGSAAFEGRLGNSHGALVPAGAWIGGEPEALTSERDVVLTVGGPGIFAYQYRVNGGAWSDTLAIGTGYDVDGTVRTDQIELSNLPNGDYTVEVLGRDFAGNWQQVPTSSQTWAVQGQLDRLQISEVLAVNQTTLNHFGSRPDVVELHNSGSSRLNLRGMSLSDDPDDPGKFVFQEDVFIGPGEYLRLFADDADSPGVHLGFSLRREGEGVFLFGEAGNQPRELIDSVEFGLQIPDYSIGRVGPDREWALTVPTLGGANRAALTGDPSVVVINEWLADASDQEDFIELYNPDPLPVGIGQYYLSDAVGGTPDRHEIAPLSYIAGRGFTVFRADGDPQDGNNHLDFRLSVDQESLGLVDPDLNIVDAVVYQPQTRGLSQGRLPDGEAGLSFFELPSPGWVNGGGVPGDFNLDSEIDVQDVDLLCASLRVGAEPLGPFDLNRDEVVSVDDLVYMIESVLNTSFGDANLDGVFNSTDFVVVFQAGQYEDDVAGNSTWATGDWDCDGDFTSGDFVTAFRNGAYTEAVARAVPAAPEMDAGRQLAASRLPDRVADLEDDQDDKNSVGSIVDSAFLVRPTQVEFEGHRPADDRVDEFFASPNASKRAVLDDSTLSELLSNLLP